MIDTHNTVGISLGWNCHSAGYGTSSGLRKRKEEGYLTCPFDEMITNLKGVQECIEDDFKYFMDEDYLHIKQAPFSTGGIIQGEYLLYNTKYNFIFNHESPGHANLYINQMWSGGINHYIDNNFALLKERYNRRVDNFRKYLHQGSNILFIITRFNKNVTPLQESISQYYPNLQFQTHVIDSPDSKEIVYDHHVLMGLEQHDINIELLQN
jgi:hypothetical protein